jgi:hypothetical protein
LCHESAVQGEDEKREEILMFLLFQNDKTITPKNFGPWSLNV